MSSKIATARALAAFVAQRALKFVTIVFFVIVAILFAMIWLLAYQFSAWWWVFAVPLFLIVAVFLAIRFMISKIITAIHRHPFTSTQRKQLNEFTQKLTNLAESRTTPLPIYALITLKDVIRYKDATTIRKLIDDSSSLRGDYKNLEKHFGEG